MVASTLDNNLDRWLPSYSSNLSKVVARNPCLWHSRQTNRAELSLVSQVLQVLHSSFQVLHSVAKSSVEKSPWYGGKAAREASTLKSFQFLRRDSEIGIARFIESKTVEFKMWGVDVELPALVMAPCGVSLEMHLASMMAGEEKKQALINSSDQLSMKKATATMMLSKEHQGRQRQRKPD
jgi:hypothetical protein